MTKGTKFTDKYITSLKPKEKEYWVREGHGFAIRVLPSGVKTWFYIYTFEGRKRFMRLGEGNYPQVSLADAREKFDVAKVKVKNGADPLAEKEQAAHARKTAPTVAELITEYIEKHAMKFKRSWAADERLLRKELLNQEKKKGADNWTKRKDKTAVDWSKRKAADITKRDVTLLLEAIVDRGAPAMSNQVLKILRKMFNFAVERDILQHTPCATVKALSPNSKRDRNLTEAEIKTLWESLDSTDMTEDVKRGIKLVLITAQRPGEVSSMHTREIDGSWWTITADKSKNGLAHRVPLTPLALQLIHEAMEDTKRSRKLPQDEPYHGYIFPCPHLKKAKAIERHALSKAVARNLNVPLVDANGDPMMKDDGTATTENKLGIEKFTPHDLRRTAATFMAQMGQMDEVIDAVLNHQKVGIIGTYNLYRYDAEKQIALRIWENKLKSIITGIPTGVVIPIRQTAAAS